MGLRQRAALLLSSYATISVAVLPPGYEDELFCPRGSCLAPRHRERGFVGPRRFYFWCIAEDGNKTQPVGWGFRVEEEHPGARNALESEGLVNSTVCNAAPAAMAWTGPRSYDAQRVDTPIQVDGNIYKPAWEEVPWSEDFVDIQGADAPQGNGPTENTRTRMKMRWDDEFLYIAAEMTAKDWPIVAEKSARNSIIFSTDSDFEVFVDADESNHYYKELEVNARNAVWNLLLDKPYSNGGGEKSGRVANPGDPNFWDVTRQRTAVRIFGDLGAPNPDGKWTAEIALYHAETLDRTKGSPPALGKFWRINFSRVERAGHFNWVWSPQMLWSPNKGRVEGTIGMHFPEVWGYVRFVAAAAGAPASSFSDPLWPLKAAASQLFIAEAHAVKEAGKVVDLDTLVRRQWVNTSFVGAFHPEIIPRGTAGDWAARLEDGQGCIASIHSDHRFRVECRSPWSVPALRLAMLVAVGIALLCACGCCVVWRAMQPTKHTD